MTLPPAASRSSAPGVGAAEDSAHEDSAHEDSAHEDSAADWPDIAAADDLVAQEYADTFADELDHMPFDRDLLDRYAATAGRGPVWDVGCGPAGHSTRYLADRGVLVTGADLSPGAVSTARQRQPGLTFLAADLCALPAPAGIAAFYSVIQLPRPRIAQALAEFGRVLAPGGALLLAMHGGSGETGTDEFLGRPATVRATLVSMTELAGALKDAGFTLAEQHERAPYPGEHPSRRLYAWAALG
ncbi:MAG: class I SAM-dependent methyltransferase [Streptosporangiaceae bacterium]|jgi:SAM-dependent methyltransferase